jgi:pimeloyl-ACP methyl ester carboxylesterase
VVHCHSLGVEQVTCYRAEVLFARAAAAAGFPVLRYHARGHGDSAGDFAAVTLESLTEDALAAAAEALRRSGATRVVWLGVRFGGLVAAAALPRGPEAAGLALWEPVHAPRDYFRAQLRGLLYSQVAEGKKPSATVDDLMARLDGDGHVDVHGYYLHRALADSVRDESLPRRLESWRGPTFLAQIEQRRSFSPAHTALVESLTARGARVETMKVPEEPGWHMVANPAWTSPELVAATAEWLRAVA